MEEHNSRVVFRVLDVYGHLARMDHASARTSPTNVQESSQQILHHSGGFTEANIKHLLAAHNDDPVIRLLEPVYATILNEPRLLEVLGTEPVWMTEGDKLQLMKQGPTFTDLTGHEIFVIDNMKVEEMAHNLGNLTTFYNRHYRSRYGAQSSRWIYNKLLEIIAGAPPNIQPNHAIKVPVIIIGSHLDSANYEFPFLPAPGADDGGSGTATILEAFRALVQTSFKPNVPVEFHWYAAEEGGLLGSQDIDIGAMIQFLTYVHKDTPPTMTFNVDTPLTNWVMNMATEYSSSAVQGAKLFPGGVSDHLSWHRAGVPIVCATESDPVRTPNPYIHTVDDWTAVKEEEFSFEYALEFAKVAVGFAVELGGMTRCRIFMIFA
ncbi:hypothetical protein V8E55_007417 [Tylopilus felleus]